MYKEKLDAYIDAHKEDMLEDLKTLVRIDSQKGEAQPGKPFGEGPAKVLDTAEAMLKKYGFQTTNYDHYVVTADYSDQEKKLDILAHLDVVPVTKNWKETEPFEPVIKDGKIYGRGTADDKGPAIAALYAMRAVKECGVPLKHSLRLILGSDEECGSEDLEYYYAKEKEAPMTFTPDADFPVINLEKGRLQKDFTQKLDAGKGVSVLRVQAGTKVNVVPDTAEALVKGLTKEEIQKFVGDDIEILPQTGKNIKLFFTNNNSKSHTITKLARTLDINFDICQGKLENFRGSMMGSLIINIEEKDLQAVGNYLDQEGITWEEIV